MSPTAALAPWNFPDPHSRLCPPLLLPLRSRSPSSDLAKPAVEPGELRAAMGRRSGRWRGFGQQDAHEFLVELLEALQSEVLAAEVREGRQGQGREGPERTVANQEGEKPGKGS